MLSYTTVVVTYNRKKELRKSIESILDQTFQANHILIIDNNSNDGTSKYVNELLENNSKIKYVKLNENVGGAGGFYYGMKEAVKLGDDLVAISDDDAYYDSKYFENIIKKAEKNPQDGAFCGCVLDSSKIQADQAKFICNKNTFKLKGATVANYQRDFYCDVFSFLGAVYRRSTIEKIGFPNKDFFIWYDDAEYSIRCNLSGIRYHCVVNALLVHNIKKLIKTPLWKEYYGFRNEIYSIKKYSKNKFISGIYITYMILKKYVAIVIRNNNYRGRRKKAFRILTKAYIDGVSNRLGKTVNP